MLDALGRVGTDVTTTDTSILWRLVDGCDGRWMEPITRAVDALTAMREVEDSRIAAGDLPSVGLLASSVERIAKGKRHDALTMTTLPIDPRPATSVPVSDRPTGGSPGDQLASVGDREGRGA